MFVIELLEIGWMKWDLQKEKGKRKTEENKIKVL